MLGMWETGRMLAQIPEFCRPLQPPQPLVARQQLLIAEGTGKGRVEGG